MYLCVPISFFWNINVSLWYIPVVLVYKLHNNRCTLAMELLQSFTKPSILPNVSSFHLTESSTVFKSRGLLLHSMIDYIFIAALTGLIQHILKVTMMTSSNGNIFRVTGHLCGEFTGPGEFPAQRPVTRSFDVFFDLRLNNPLSKQWWGWCFETLSRPLWRHCNATWIQSERSDNICCDGSNGRYVAGILLNGNLHIALRFVP